MNEFRTGLREGRVSIGTIVRHAFFFGRLYVHLLRDRRVPLYLKLFFFLTILYIASPLDLVPEAFLSLFGIVDDVGLLALMLTYFLKRCPKDVLMEHAEALGR